MSQATRPRTRIVKLALSVAALMCLAACFGSKDDSTNGPPPAPVCTTDSAATYWLQALSDTLNALNGRTRDQIQVVRLDDIRAGLNTALQQSDVCQVAHLGVAILEMLELNYNDDIWAMIDSLWDYSENGGAAPIPPIPGAARGLGLYLPAGSPILGNQFTLLASAPTEWMRQSLTSFPGNITVARFQEIVDQHILPAINRSLSHMQKVEANGGPRMALWIEDEWVEIDQGEVLLFHAGLLAARAGLYIGTAYDYDVLGEDGTYGWIDEARQWERARPWAASLQPIVGSTDSAVVYLTFNRLTQAKRDSVVLEALRYNLTSRPQFLAARNNRMSAALSDIRAVRDKLDEAVAAIRSEPDDQGDDVIKISTLTDWDREIQQDGSIVPRIQGETFTSVEDVLEFVDRALNGSIYHLQFEAPGRPETAFTLDVNISALFTNAPANWKQVLPYYRFRAGPWFTSVHEVLDWGWDVTPGTLYCFYNENYERICSTNVAREEYRHIQGNFEAFDLLDGPNGNPIDLDVAEVPYLPDYTMGGLFPGANRDKWLEVVRALKEL